MVHILRGESSTVHYRLFFDKHPHPMWVFDADTFVFLEVNDAALRSYGYTREEFLALKVTDIRPPEDVARFLAHRPGLQTPLRHAGVWRHRKKDGTLIDVEVAASDVDFKGHRAVLVSAVDVTERRRLEASMMESEARLRGYLEAASEGIVVVGADGLIEFVNARTEEMFGYWREELLGAAVEVLLPERYREIHRANRASGAGRPMGRPLGSGVEMVGRRKNGAEFPVEVGLSSVAAGSAQVEVAFINDITVRRQNERELRESEQRFRNLVETSSDWVWETDAQGCFTWVSPQIRDVLGYEPEELVGRNPFDMMPAGEGAELKRRLDPVMQAGGRVSRLESTLLGKDGSPVVVESSGVPFFDPAGNLLGYRGTARDITGRKRFEHSLRASQERLIRAQRIAHLGHWERDVRTGELMWSDEVYRIFGVDPGRFRPTLEAFAAMVHPDDRAGVKAAVVGSLETGKPYSIDHRIVLADGSERHVHEHAEVVRDDHGAPVRLLGTVQDITDYKRLEEQLRQSQRMEAVGRLAGGVAHDFNNLLTIISGYTELLLGEAEPNSPVHHDLNEVSRAAGRAASLTRQLLAFSRRQILQLRPLNLNTVIADLDKMLQRLIGEDIELVTKLAPGLGQAKADPTQIEQVIMNLAVNARDAMPDGGRLMLETANVELDDHYSRSHPEVQSGPHVMIAVTDTGVGMDEHVREHIFEPFFTTKARDKGTGLGLSTVYGIVKQSGGSVFVYSEPGRGSTFKIYLPRIEEVIGLPEQKAAAPVAPRGSETILLVEDEEGVRMLVRTILEAHGYTVLEAARGKEALRLLAEQATPVDLIITDVIMPEMSGRELALGAARVSPNTRVLYMSGYTDEAIVQHGVLDPGIPFLQKPFTHDALTTKIREVLQGAMKMRP